MLSRAGQCGIDTAKVSLAEVEAVATMDRPAKYAHVDINESILYSASTLHLHGLPYDYASLKLAGPLDECGVCNTILVDPLRQEPLY